MEKPCHSFCKKRLACSGRTVQKDTLLLLALQRFQLNDSDQGGLAVYRAAPSSLSSSTWTTRSRVSQGRTIAPQPRGPKERLSLRERNDDDRTIRRNLFCRPLFPFDWLVVWRRVVYVFSADPRLTVYSLAGGKRTIRDSRRPDRIQQPASKKIFSRQYGSATVVEEQAGVRLRQSKIDRNFSLESWIAAVLPFLTRCKAMRCDDGKRAGASF
jgi:hypothetical protein